MFTAKWSQQLAFPCFGCLFTACFAFGQLSDGVSVVLDWPLYLSFLPPADWLHLNCIWAYIGHIRHALRNNQELT